MDAAALAFTIWRPPFMSLYTLYAWGADITATLDGAQEVPPVQTNGHRHRNANHRRRPSS
jgi:hypothetical protein